MLLVVNVGNIKHGSIDFDASIVLLDFDCCMCRVCDSLMGIARAVVMGVGGAFVQLLSRRGCC